MIFYGSGHARPGKHNLRYIQGQLKGNSLFFFAFNHVILLFSGDHFDISILRLVIYCQYVTCVLVYFFRSRSMERSFKTPKCPNDLIKFVLIIWMTPNQYLSHKQDKAPIHFNNIGLLNTCTPFEPLYFKII